VKKLLKCKHPPERIIQWPENWLIEDVIGWIIEGDKGALAQINLLDHIICDVNSVQEIVERLKSDDRSMGGLKKNYLAYDDIASEISYLPGCLDRTIELLNSLLAAITSSKNDQNNSHLQIQEISESKQTYLYRWTP